jgi:hypothetical protein
MKTKVLILVLVLALSLVVVGVALANNGVERPRWVLSGGASDAAVGNVTLRATLGQPIVGTVSASAADITLGQGFWRGGSLFGGYDVYLPLIQR